MEANAPYWWQQPNATAIAGPTYTLAKKTEPETAVAAPLCLLRPPRPGDTCPFCQQATLAYDALFLLTCPTCGQIVEAGCFT